MNTEDPNVIRQRAYSRGYEAGKRIGPTTDRRPIEREELARRGITSDAWTWAFETMLLHIDKELLACQAARKIMTGDWRGFQNTDEIRLGCAEIAKNADAWFLSESGDVNTVCKSSGDGCNE